MKQALVTGAAGFIGFHLVRALLRAGYAVVGIDNLNSYYSPALKLARLAESGIDADVLEKEGRACSVKGESYCFLKLDLADREAMERLFEENHFNIVINFAGQAGVRYSIENPYSYVESNVLGFLNVLECCRHHRPSHLLYASSSSVYGMQDVTPYREDQMTDTPVSLYAATKKSNELMAHAYSKLYGIPATGLRFFTVYGPWGRPDMAPFLFLRNVLAGQPIRVFNHGDLSRDFTYVDDIISGVMSLLDHIPSDSVPHIVYNIGHSSPVRLMDFIREIERVAGRPAVMKMEEMQPGDVYSTFADTTRLQQATGYVPRVALPEGISRFYDWYVGFYGQGTD
ncbi:MAG: NAD-dependent epimerase/dehydratase family protein [Alloprevotella sp.]